jgi:hypothetical protein
MAPWRAGIVRTSFLVLVLVETFARAEPVPVATLQGGRTITQPTHEGGLTKAEAAKLAAAEVARQAADSGVIAEQTQEHNFGWVFFWGTLKYARTGDIRDAAPGCVPFAITRDGELRWLANYNHGGVQKLQQEWQGKHPGAKSPPPK